MVVRDGRNIPNAPVDAVGEQSALMNGNGNPLQSLRIIIFSREVEYVSVKLQIRLAAQPFCQLVCIRTDTGAAATAGLQF